MLVIVILDNFAFLLCFVMFVAFDIFVVSLGTASFWSSALMLEVGWQIHDNGLIRPPLEVNLIPMLPVVSLYLSTKDLHF